MQHLILLYFSFSMLTIITCLELYLIINIKNTSTQILIIIIIRILSYYLTAASLTFMVHYIIYKKYIIWRNTIVLLFTLAALLYHLIPILINFKISQTSEYYISEIIFISFMIYNLLTCIILFKKIKDREIKKITIFAVILLTVFLPWIINDLINFLKLPEEIYFFPFVYIGNSIIIISYILRNYFKISNQNNIQNLIESLNTDFFETYNISPREKDIFLLILKGYGNKKISEKLFISISPVKKHIYTIFKKTNVKTRFELITLIQNYN